MTVFSEKLTSVLTGATTSQLRRWRGSGLLVPEIRPKRPPLYSFRDLVALRTTARLRASTSLQSVRRAVESMDMQGFRGHLSEYAFHATGDRSIVLELPDGGLLDLVRKPGVVMPQSFAEVFAPFLNMHQQEVVDFFHPRPHLEVLHGRMGGLPTIDGTRLPYDSVAQAIDGREITVEDVHEWYPSATPEAARDALSFHEQVEAA